MHFKWAQTANTLSYPSRAPIRREAAEAPAAEVLMQATVCRSSFRSVAKPITSKIMNKWRNSREVRASADNVCGIFQLDIFLFGRAGAVPLNPRPLIKHLAFIYFWVDSGTLYEVKNPRPIAVKASPFSVNEACERGRAPRWEQEWQDEAEDGEQISNRSSRWHKAGSVWIW